MKDICKETLKLFIALQAFRESALAEYISQVADNDDAGIKDVVQLHS